MFCGTGSGTGTGSKTISAAAGFSGGWNHYAVVVDRDGDMLTYFNGIQSDRITISGSTGTVKVRFQLQNYASGNRRIYHNYTHNNNAESGSYVANCGLMELDA